MQSCVRSLTLLAMALTAALGPHLAAAQQTMDFNKAELIRSLLPSVVNVTTTVATANASSPETLHGSGFVIDPSGLIATNDHVIHGGYQLQVTFSDGQTVPAKLVATAPTIDIAVIKSASASPNHRRM
jgi:serine protease Do